MTDHTELIRLLLPRLPASQQVLWAADCVERVLPIFEAKYPDDVHPRCAIAAARAGAVDAAHAAADAAAHAAYAAHAAANAAARAAAHAANAAAQSAHAAANAAARAAAHAADAACAANNAETEREWQLVRLLRYLHPGESEEQTYARYVALMLTGVEP